MRSVRGVFRSASRYRRGTLALVVSGLYVLLVVVGLVIVTVGMSGSDEQGLSAVTLILVTLPLSWLVMMIPGEALPVGAHLALLIVAGLVQAWLLWFLLRGPRKEAPPPQER
ncbi:hypothetical protein ABT352_14730 [Streptosporangium sp. NPDC000563]|uniref:SCO4225 family membrane protein n=1 Tax=unclassified Streptosporangium TaxID=2632669 RepID=UPI003320D344